MHTFKVDGTTKIGFKRDVFNGVVSDLNKLAAMLENFSEGG